MSLKMWIISHIKKKRNKYIGKSKIYWYRAIPYVIAEIENPEWEKLKELEKEKKFRFKQLRKIYNSNGNWYILEGLDYFWFGLQIITKKEKEILFSDSCHFSFNEKSDKEKYQMLKEHAKENIDNLWDNFYKFFKKEKKYCTRKDNHLQVPGNIYTAKCSYCGKPPLNKLKK